MVNRMFRAIKSMVACAGLASLLGVSGAANAFPIASSGDGLSVVVGTTGHVIATYQGNSAAFSNDLYLGNTFIFNNHATVVGTSVDLGLFTAGTELIFRLHVNNTGFDYFTGPASRNPDNHVHARVQNNWQPGETLVSFEDLLNGPFDYNDLSFSFTNTRATTVPEPGTALLAGGALLMLGMSARRRARNARQA